MSLHILLHLCQLHQAALLFAVITTFTLILIVVTYVDLVVDWLNTIYISKQVHCSTHPHGHVLDLILTPSGSDYVRIVNTENFVSDHAIINCHLDFSIQDKLCQKGNIPKESMIDLTKFKMSSFKVTLFSLLLYQ